MDILSGGRVDWGSGKSSSLVEQGAFEIDRGELDGQWREALAMIPRMWRDELFEWHGTHYRVPPTAILPKPIQQPHPPIFVACSRPETVGLAGSLGVGSLNFTAGNDDYLKAKIATYRAAIAGARGPAGVVNNRFCCTPTTIVLDDDRRACESRIQRRAIFSGVAGDLFFFTRARRAAGPLLAGSPDRRRARQGHGGAARSELDADVDHR